MPHLASTCRLAPQAAGRRADDDARARSVCCASGGGPIRRLALAALAFTSLLLLASSVAAQEEDDDFDDRQRFAPGLVAHFESAVAPAAEGDAPANALQRIAVSRAEHVLRFAWDEHSPDPRLPEGPFAARWQGQLFTIAPGAYRLHVYAAGQVRIELAGRLVLDSASNEPAWHAAQPGELVYGYHPLAIEYRGRPPRAHLAVYWEGPQFALEPLPPQSLFHERSLQVDDTLDRGETLVHALGCAACHRLPRAPTAVPAADLSRLAGNLQRKWLVEWLTHRHAMVETADDRAEGDLRIERRITSAVDRPSPCPLPEGEDSSDEVILRSDLTAGLPRRMPSFGLTHDEARAVAAYLLDPPNERGGESRADGVNAHGDDSDGNRASVGDNGDSDSVGNSGSTNGDAGDGRDNTSARSDAVSALPESAAERGRHWFRTLGCLACHRAEALGSASLLSGGDLSRVADKRPAEFFARWLEAPAALNVRHRMPIFPLSDQQRLDLAAYLATLGESDPQQEGAHAPRAVDQLVKGGPHHENSPAERSDSSGELTDDLAAHGARVVAQQRCGACHLLPAASHLTDAARPPRPTEVPLDPLAANWETSCLAQPDRATARPGYQLAPHDRRAIARYLTQLAAAEQTVVDALDGDDTLDAARTADSVDVEGHERAARAAAADRDATPAHHMGRLVLAERNCLGCHDRDLSPGLAERLETMVGDDAEAAARLPRLKPPTLTGIGDKLHEPALRAAIRTSHEPRRPWLDVRMPRYDLSDEELDCLVDYFVESDRIPERPPEYPAPVAPAASDSVAAEAGRPSHRDELASASRGASPGLSAHALELAGRRLVTADGFGCTSCHQVGRVVPQNVALAAQGTDLSLVGERIRPEWFQRWVRNPARIVPRMEMPSIQAPIRGVLDDDLGAQLAAVWHVLNQPSFQPPEPDPIRTVRRQNVPEVDQRAAVLTDVLHIDRRPHVKPLIVGLANRHNVLYDLSTARLAAWWIGDVARQRVSGKSWYWEPGGTLLLASTANQRAGADGEWALVDGTGPIAPIMVGAWRTELDSWRHTPGGVVFTHRLRFPAGDASADGDGSAALEATVVQEIATCRTDRSDGGFERSVQLCGLPPGQTILWSPLPDLTSDAWQADDAGRMVEVAGQLGACRVELLEPPGAVFISHDAQPAVSLVADERGCAAARIAATSAVPADRFVLTEPPHAIAVEPAAVLEVAPGFEALRVTLPDEVMPTGLAWREDGALVVSSLKGRVWLLHDRSGDGLPDETAPYSDELAAPYGVAAAPDGAIDVINKFALLRLWDDDGDGRADRSEVLASGWGHTDDYHDWAVGLVRDDEGAYFIALPCQQDNRSPAEAHLRGRALRLTPPQRGDGATPRYDIEEWCAGLRFPMGLALSREGTLVASDNQGNFNPFNELNHLLRGAHYGFVNKLEARRGPRPPLRPPAVNIPHPLTRSVNGIAFLYTPPAVEAELGQTLFGPFEGHLIGCEYDTRALVRISLEPAGDSYQGAVYPFSVPPAAGGEPLEGPVVCAVSPEGDLYVGNLRDSGWGGGTNTGSLVRMRRTADPLPPGIAEVRATPRGFAVRFTAAVDRARAADLGSYAISSYRRESTPAYGGDDRERRNETIRGVRVSADAREALVELGTLRAGFVYELHLAPIAPGGQPLVPAEAHYTLHHVPVD